MANYRVTRNNSSITEDHAYVDASSEAEAIKLAQKLDDDAWIDGFEDGDTNYTAEIEE